MSQPRQAGAQLKDQVNWEASLQTPPQKEKETAEEREDASFHFELSVVLARRNYSRNCGRIVVYHCVKKKKCRERCRNRERGREAKRRDFRELKMKKKNTRKEEKEKERKLLFTVAFLTCFGVGRCCREKSIFLKNISSHRRDHAKSIRTCTRAEKEEIRRHFQIHLRRRKNFVFTERNLFLFSPSPA